MISLMIKPASSRCNLECSYCFYRDTAQNRTPKKFYVMPAKTVDKIVEKINEPASIVFQGGEPTLAGIEYFRYFVNSLKDKGLEPLYSIQTNGTLLNDEWCYFFKEFGFLVGLSMDGTEEIHNANRDGSFDAVLKALNLLKKHEIEYSVLCVINSNNWNKAEEIYSFFKKNDIKVMQFIPCIDSFSKRYSSLSGEEYGHFLCKLFDLWKEDVFMNKMISIRYFENILRILLGMDNESCGFGKCANQFVIEADGDIYPCDFYCLDEWKVGNISDKSLDMDKLHEFMTDFVSKECRMCRYARLCKGGCKRDYVEGKSRFCESYKMFFEHSYDGLLEIRDYLRGK